MGCGTVDMGVVRTHPPQMQQRTPLRVGAMIRTDSVPRWIANLLDGIETCAFAELAGLVCDPEAEPRPRPNLLYSLYTRLDRRRVATVPDPLDEINVSERLVRLPVCSAEAITDIEGWDLDVLLALGFGGIPRALLGCARHGVWSYRHGDGISCLGGPRLFWDTYHGAPVSGSLLMQHTADPARHKVIYSSCSAPDPISLHRGRARICAKSAEFVVRRLRDLHRDGELRAEQNHADARDFDAPRCDAPTNREMLRFGWTVGRRAVRQKARRLLARPQWFIAFQPRGSGLPTAERFRSATLLVPPDDRFFADPCLVDWKDSSYLFFEEFRFAEQRGSVSCSRLVPDGRWTRPETVLERPYHLSYPFVFFVGEDAFMLPETAANGGIELYRAHAFPGEWALEAVLVPGVHAVDPTLIEHGDRYWLFANVAVDGASTNDELFLYSSHSLRGPWEPHPRNPIVSDVRRARPAGRPFLDESGALIRPAQDCSGFYGSAVVFNRIETLNETEYRETAVGRLDPSWRRSNVGTHTFTRSELWEALDGRAWKLRYRTLRLRALLRA